MGLFDFFSDRRKRESAIPSVTGTEGFKPISSTPADVPEGAIEIPNGLGDNGAVQLQGIGDLAGLGALIQTALAQGNVSVSQGSQVIDMRGTGMREDMLETLKTHGIDVEALQANQAQAGQQAQAIDAGAIDGLGPAILGLLAQNGVDLDSDGVPDHLQRPKPD